MCNFAVSWMRTRRYQEKRWRRCKPRSILKENTPDWIIGIGGLVKGTLEQFAARYEVVAKLDVFRYPTQRSELNYMPLLH